MVFLFSFLAAILFAFHPKVLGMLLYTVSIRLGKGKHVGAIFPFIAGVWLIYLLFGLLFLTGISFIDFSPLFFVLIGMLIVTGLFDCKKYFWNSRAVIISKKRQSLFVNGLVTGARYGIRSSYAGLVYLQSLEKNYLFVFFLILFLFCLLLVLSGLKRKKGLLAMKRFLEAKRGLIYFAEGLFSIILAWVLLLQYIVL